MGNLTGTIQLDISNNFQDHPPVMSVAANGVSSFIFVTKPRRRLLIYDVVL